MYWHFLAALLEHEYVSDKQGEHACSLQSPQSIPAPHVRRPLGLLTHSPTVGVYAMLASAWPAQSTLYPFVCMTLHSTYEYWIGQQSRAVKRRYARYAHAYLALLVLTALEQRHVALYLSSACKAQSESVRIYMPILLNRPRQTIHKD